MGNRWGKIWNVVSLTCTIVVALGAIVGIWAFLLKPTAKLSAVVKYSEIQWPSTIVALAQKLDELFEVENIRKAIADSNITSEDENLAEDFSKYLKDGLPELRSAGGLITHLGSYRIEITNEGRKVCTGVSVKLPRSWLVNVWREDNTIDNLGECSVIAIGDLRPQERVVLLAWSSLRVYEPYAKKIRVSHDLGVASMDIRSSVGRVGRWVDKHLFGIVFGLCAALLAVLWVVPRVWGSEKMREAKSENEEVKGDSCTVEKVD